MSVLSQQNPITDNGHNNLTANSNNVSRSTGTFGKRGKNNIRKREGEEGMNNGDSVFLK